MIIVRWIPNFGGASGLLGGWTPQELLDPNFVGLCDGGWIEIGTKSSLQDLITSITVISSLFEFGEECVVQKMSWAAGSRTTRVED